MKKELLKYSAKLQDDFSIKYKSDIISSKKPFHIHSQFEIVFSLTDEIICELENQTVPVPPGCFLLLNHMDLHCLRTCTNQPCRRYVLFFSPEYLSGFQAEKRDMDESLFTPEVEEEVKSYTVQNLMNSLEAYSPVRIKESETVIHDAKWQYALLPVWVLTYRSRDKGTVYYFAMNGQTGKVCGRLPVDKRRLGMLFLAVFLPVFLFLLAGGWFL